MLDDAARKMAEEIVEAIQDPDLRHPEREQWIASVLARLRPLLAERDRLREFAAIVRDCPVAALHLMPLAAQAALSQLALKTTDA